MFSLFKTKKVQEPAVKYYTAEEIHGVIVAKNLALLSNMIELTKKDLVKAPTNVAFEYSRLQQLGLTNTKNAGILKSKLDEIEFLNKKTLENTMTLLSNNVSFASLQRIC